MHCQPFPRAAVCYTGLTRPPLSDSFPLLLNAMATENNDGTASLQELLLFVNDRIEGYKKAVEESKDHEMQGYYKQLVSQSQQFANELNAYLRKQGEDPETGTTLKGKLYRGWTDAKALLTATDEKAILSSNVYGEEWALKAYQDALDDHHLPASIRPAVERQFHISEKTYKKLKKLEHST
ncbi:conserved hypothetical protein [Hymenobacter roseosalivarius DSM 11622]|uniref:DUF2383 domain-containing protein n=2 Tax=Hymenobacter roseosalivarius TaxID=89967 RepID=A0A1W1URZ1_9BACT|nr:conserved hypothetical protein [Hymenobacter roseosalivarius DSM 11622]